MSFSYFSNEDHLREEELLKERFIAARPVKGTLSMHACLPLQKGKSMFKTFFCDRKPPNHQLALACTHPCSFLVLVLAKDMDLLQPLHDHVQLVFSSKLGILFDD
ncbi:hypothetical protein J437_LFUL006164 [Ladona fulva]|uniref:Uncharacterized protein n=1 Tax=Ladona fulva TaxID=123851 RepID=A0A8K0NUJ5_LADFU|nr:hypothetical protein J437_LFUL006164 [Ladona fulva]